MPLDRYHQKRNFTRTPEPAGSVGASGQQLQFVIQKHAARRLHYDFRLELDGVLKSWAVPKGPSLNPADKRLAVHVEDHPLDYGRFEGTIPPHQYGAGHVIVWDSGSWTPLGDPHAGYRKGHLRFTLHGHKLAGEWSLVRMKAREDGDDNWLLLKADDAEARHGDDADITAAHTRSVLSGRDLDDVVAGKKGRKPEAASSSAAAPAGQSGTGTKTAAANTSRAKAARTERSAPPVQPAQRTRKQAHTALPATLQPQLATLCSCVPDDEDNWLAEIKFDGYRILARCGEDGVQLYSRSGNDWTGRMQPVADALATLDLAGSWLDGEVVAVDESGQIRFQLLQNAFAGEGGKIGRLIYYVFDAPWLKGKALAAQPLQQRKSALAAVLAGADAALPIRYSDHLSGQLQQSFDHACRHGLEGLILKRADSSYHPGARSRDWLKLKCQHRQEFVVGGYTDPAGSRSALGALLLGVHEDGQLRYAGRVGTGFTEKRLAELLARLQPLQRKAAPFARPPSGGTLRGVHWVKPQLVAEVRFAEWTEDHLVRQAAFLGLRDDKDPASIVRESASCALPDEHTRKQAKAAATDTKPAVATRSATQDPATARGKQTSVQKKPACAAQTETAEVAGVRISHASRILFADAGITKGDLARYYQQVADWIVPQLDDRPVSLVRCPEGAAHACFFQRHLTPTLPGMIKGVEIVEAGSGKTATYMEVDTLAGIVSLVQLGVLEFHTWGARADAPDQPDRFILDLDPAPDVVWPTVIESAHLVRGLLDELGLQSFLKTSGGKGLHLEVPLARTHSWDTVKDFSHAIADHLARVLPARFIAKSTKARRNGKIYVDYLRNSKSATAIAAYSSRARPQAPVAMPISWDQLDGLHSAADFTVQNTPDYLASREQDPWQDYARAAQRITRQMQKKLGM
ncbi:Multifunctional non-homologous end joining protein LigD [Andreprevotia sp. IGB-42]|uniref:DNA ligase D n=1 Tax=Andreprevotia sp. IGB-42 TaxID=2497473 RepID=UPI00135B44A4|nr:DNA ligase D [Andreprevotia sp. IGB-42]KAF0813643.1 Multifunctional non-homologous end joining protein LigD [Andreprevotia sp. IGB-42]